METLLTRFSTEFSRPQLVPPCSASSSNSEPFLPTVHKLKFGSLGKVTLWVVHCQLQLPTIKESLLQTLQLKTWPNQLGPVTGSILCGRKAHNLHLTPLTFRWSHKVLIKVMTRTHQYSQRCPCWLPSVKSSLPLSDGNPLANFTSSRLIHPNNQKTLLTVTRYLLILHGTKSAVWMA